MPASYSYVKRDINPEKLAEYVHEHAAPFFELCVMIENISAVTYKPFYNSIREDFRSVFEHGGDVNTVSTKRMREAYNDFQRCLEEKSSDTHTAGAGLDENSITVDSIMEYCRREHERFFAGKILHYKEWKGEIV